jgi:two-component sensor histidine kinase
MAVHELATNAAKYGALSTPSGRVDLSWKVQGKNGGRSVRLHWAERDGPAVSAPQRKGFGTRLLERGIQAELHGTTAIHFLHCGLECEIIIPLADVED